jgi:hypothetical protein
MIGHPVVETEWPYEVEIHNCQVYGRAIIQLQFSSRPVLDMQC